MPRPFGDVLPDSWLCSWHAGEPELVGNGGARDSYVDYFRWSCCGQGSTGAVIGGIDYPARRSPGCKRGPHIEDPTLVLDPSLSNKLQSLQERLLELEGAQNVKSGPPSVFISYSHADSQLVNLIAKSFQEAAIEYWRDEKDILVGEVIDQAISDGIQRNALFLLVLSPKSISSKWVTREIDEAAHEHAEGRKIIIPILAGGLDPQDIPARLRRLKCANLSNPTDESILLLIRSVQKHIERNVGGAA